MTNGCGHPQDPGSVYVRTSGMVPIRSPRIGDATYAAAGDGKVVLLARANNVLVALVSSDREFSAKLMLGSLNTMAERVNAAARANDPSAAAPTI